MKILSDFINLFFPPLCIHCCCRLKENETHICLSCLNNIPETEFHNQTDNKLEVFFSGRFPFVRIASFAHFAKDGIIQSIVHELKYNNNPDIGEYIGKLIGKRIADSDFISSVDYIIPVPLHPRREEERGYNQSEKLAAGMSAGTKVKVNTNNLIRTKNTMSQTKHSRFERWSNTEGIFMVNNPELFAGKHILLIDDILTTGSTLESCAKTILKSCEGSKISIYTMGAVTD